MRRQLAIFGTLAVLVLLPNIVQHFYPADILDSCGILREAVRKQEALASDADVDAVMATFGPLDRGKCLTLAVRQPPLPSSPEASAAEKEIYAAINACMAKRISGELPGFGASAQCAAARIVTALDKANYPHMDLITQFNSRRIEIFQRYDRHEVDEAYLAREQYRLIVAFIAAQRSREQQPDHPNSTRQN